jgi:hypothetical protein
MRRCQLFLALGLLLTSVHQPDARIVTQYSGGRVTFLAHQFGPGAVRATLPLGMHALPPADEYVLDFWVRVRAGWMPGLGGKLAGLGGGSVTSGCAPIRADGWSARYMWGSGSTFLSYLYHQDRQSACGDGTAITAGQLSPQWTRLTQQVRVNTPGQANGVITIWVNGQVSATRTNLRFRGNVPASTARVDRVILQPFRGGSEAAWAVARETSLEFSPVYVLDCVPTFAGGSPTTPPTCAGVAPPSPALPPVVQPPLRPPVPAFNLWVAWDYPIPLQPVTHFELRMTTLVQGRPVATAQQVLPVAPTTCPQEQLPVWMPDSQCAQVCIPPGDYTFTLRALHNGVPSAWSNAVDQDASTVEPCAGATPVAPLAEQKPSPVAPVVGAVVVGGAIAASGSSVSIPALVNRQCVDWRIEGPCACGFPPHPCVKVSYHEPRWIAEVVKRPGTSALPVLGNLLPAALSVTGIPALGGGGAGNASGSGHTNIHFSEVRIWSFPQVLGSPCTGCAPVNAVPVLHYASELDAATWRTAVAAPVPLPGLLPVGVWGNVYPRSGHVIHGSPPIAAALIAVRAMDIVRQPVGMPPHLDPHVVTAPAPAFSTCIQMGSPRVSPCLVPGVPPPLLETAAVAPNGNYVFIFWAKRDCCVEPAMSTCGLTTPGIGGHGANFCAIPNPPIP